MQTSQQLKSTPFLLQLLCDPAGAAVPNSAATASAAAVIVKLLQQLLVLLLMHRHTSSMVGTRSAKAELDNMEICCKHATLLCHTDCA